MHGPIYIRFTTSLSWNTILGNSTEICRCHFRLKLKNIVEHFTRRLSCGLFRYYLSQFLSERKNVSNKRSRYKLNDLYCSPNIVRVIKSRRMRWDVHVARMGEERGCGNRRERDHWGDLGVDGLIILGWISGRWDVGIWTGLGWPRIETGGGRLWVR